MADRPPEEQGLLGGVRRAVGGALDATVGRVGSNVSEAALDLTGATAQQVLEDLEPYLVQEAIPRIVAGITPYLSESVVPEVLEGIQDHLVEVTIPEVVDGVTAHLVEVTVPEVVDGVTPRLVEDLLPRLLTDLRPYLEQELVPRIVEGLVPHLSQTVAPDLVDALMPKIEKEVAPQLIDALMPKIEKEVAPQLVDALMPTITERVAPDLVRALMPMIQAEVAPQLVDALMPRIEQEVAPRLVDVLMPKIRNEVVPTVLDDIVDDPRIRDLIREQSQGLFLDALESLRENLADADDLAERVGRRVVRRPPREAPQSALTMALDATGRGQASAMRTSLHALEEQRRAWAASPSPPSPPGREFAHAGAVTRLVGFAVDVALVGWLISQGLSALVGLLDALLSPIPAWLTAALGGVAASLVPVYLALSWWLTGRSLGSWLVGIRVCTPDGRNPGLVRALVRSWAGVLGIVVWVLTGFASLFDAKRRSWLDRLLHTEVRYVVPDNQQHRYIREALQARREERRAQQEAEDAGGPAESPPTTA